MSSHMFPKMVKNTLHCRRITFKCQYLVQQQAGPTHHPRNPKHPSIRMSACTFINGLFTSPVPAWADPIALKTLQSATKSGLAIDNEDDYSHGVMGANKAIETALKRLESDGVIPHDIDSLLINAHEAGIAQAMELGEEVSALLSLRELGNPAYVHVNIAQILDVLRFLARSHEQNVGQKPTLQLGVLTMMVQGSAKSFGAQVFPADTGVVTETVWLYRWCVYNADGGYDEHWRPFLRKSRRSEVPELVNAKATFNPQNILQDPTAAPPRPRKRAFEEEQTPTLPTTQPIPANKPLAGEPRTKRHRHNRFHNFNHWVFTTDELFIAEPYMIQGDCIIRLAHSLTNAEIRDRINANHPGSISSVNVITKRLTHAIERAAEATGKSVMEVRQEIANAKAANGVANKAKIDTSVYTNRPPTVDAGFQSG